MRVIFSTVGQIALLVVLASAVALAANAKRGKNSIDLDRKYFGVESPAPEPNQPRPTTDPNSTTSTGEEHKFPFRVMDIQGIKEAVGDARLQTGEIVIVDARADEPFQAGRVPGSIQFDYYRAEYYLDTVLPRIMAAQQVIVYCNGGACEDSILTCNHFVSLGIPEGHLCLFKDGWEAWKKSGLPIETGPAKE